MKVATVTLTYNRLAALQRCLDSVRPEGIDQIIVVDNHTDDGTSKWLSEQTDIYTVRLPENRGVTARNYGFDIVRKDIDIVVQIDDDVTMTSGWKNVVLAALAPDNVIGTGQAGGFVGDFTSLLPASVPPGTSVDTLTGFCWAIAKHRLDAADDWDWVRYDEDFGMRWHEETDLQCALRAATGMHLVTCPFVAIHNSMAGPVDWELHNRNLERLREKWMHKLVSAKPRSEG